MSQIKLDYLSVIKASGTDAGDYLQAQLTADLNDLADGQARLSAYCRPTGKVMAIMLVINSGDHFKLVTSDELVNDLLAELGKFILRSDVKLERTRDIVIGAPGGGDTDPSEFVELADTNLIYGIVNLFDESQPSSASETQIQENARQTWKKAELDSGVVWLNGQTTDQYLPQMLGLESLQALSFRKGCFPGQEVIARVKYLGKLKRRSLVLEFNSDLELAIGDQLTLVSEDGIGHRADIVDFARTGDALTVFVITRAPHGTVIKAVEKDDKKLPLTVSVQA